MRRVDEWELRKIFNTFIEPRLEAGELVALVTESGPADPANNQPPGTISELVYIYEPDERGNVDMTRPIAKCHRYRRPGEYSRLDPKVVEHDGQRVAGHR